MKPLYLKEVGFALFCMISLPFSIKAQTTLTYSYTGAMESFTVPACVSSLTLDVMGSKGGDCIYNQAGTKPDDLGGLGGRVVAVYPVTPGQVLNIFVGGISYNGGGTGAGSIAQAHGGGASDIRIGGINLADRIIVAGGGGGGGNNCSANAEPGGDGGGLTGATGWQCGNQTGTAVGQGGTQTAGGAPGTSPATAGALGIGGNAGGAGTASGGGGGGYYGGGGAAFGGGGGGSSYTGASATSVVHTPGFRNGTGLVTISYNTAAPAITAASTSVCSGSSATLTAGTTPATTYSWSNGATTASISVSPTVTMVYSVTATNACGSSSAAVTVTVNNLPSVSLPSSVPVCNTNTTVILNATGNAVSSYSWNTGATTMSISVSPSVTASYTVVGTGICGTATAVTTVSLTSAPTVSVSSASSTICANSPVVLTASVSGTTSYTWSTGATSASISVTPGTTTVYTVIASNACGTATASLTQYVVSCTGIHELAGSQPVQLYPNPASDRIHILVPDDLLSATISIELTDALGRLVSKEILAKDDMILNLTRLEQGIYFYKIMSTGHLIQSGRILKQ